MTGQSRTPAGVPTGGQFTASARAESDTQPLTEILSAFDAPVTDPDGTPAEKCLECGSDNIEDYYGDGDYHCFDCDEDEEEDPL